MSNQWLQQLFNAIDAKDTPRFLEFLTEDAVFRFGNQPLRRGKQDIGTAVEAFFGSIKACRHEVAGSWAHPDHIICHGLVTYTRKDATQVTVPFANVLTLRRDRINSYLIFADISPLFAAA